MTSKGKRGEGNASSKQINRGGVRYESDGTDELMTMVAKNGSENGKWQ